METGSSDSNYSSKRILKNTVFLYLRQIITLVVSLYTSRVTLDVLGIDNYGLYNVIAGVVVLLALVNNSMVSATQRFLTYEIGRGDIRQISNTFSMSMTAHIIICVLVFIVGETLGLWYIIEYLIVPDGRMNAAFWVYQISLLSVYVNIIRSPYQASIISYEKMNFFAIVSVAEVVVKLLIVFMLFVVPYDKLILYTLLLFASNLLITVCYRIYCNRMFETCRYYYFMDRSYFIKLSGYLGWNVVGAFSTMGTQQASNMIINRYVGVAMNAAYGIANQISAALGSFLSNFQMAFQPQIVKLYAQDEKALMFKLMNRTARLSYYLTFIVVAPLFFCLDLVLNFWLKEVPPSTATFCLWLFLTTFLNAIQCPLWISIGATGNNKVYQIWQSCVWFLSLPLLYLFLNDGYPAYWVVIIRFFLALVSTIFLLIHVKIQIGFPVLPYIKEVLGPILLITFLFILPSIYLQKAFTIDDFISFVFYYTIAVVFISFLVFSFGVDNSEREYILNLVRSKIKIL